jgi:uncharacterized protein (DUF302 family)
MSTRRIEIVRVSVTTSKPFEAVVAALKAGVGRLDLVAFAQASKSPSAFAELEEVINRDMGKTGLMLFVEFDHGAVLRKETGLDKPRIVRLVIGNPLVMKEMAKHVPDAGSYAPVTVLVDERQDGVHLSYDKMVSLLVLLCYKLNKIGVELFCGQTLLARPAGEALCGIYGWPGASRGARRSGNTVEAVLHGIVAAWRTEERGTNGCTPGARERAADASVAASRGGRCSLE